MASVQDYDMPQLEAVRGHRVRIMTFYDDEDLLNYDFMKQLTGDPIHFNAVKAMAVDYYNKNK